MESPSSDKFISVTAKIVSTNPLVIESDQLITFKAVNKETGQLGIGYILKSEKAEKNLSEASATPLLRRSGYTRMASSSNQSISLRFPK